MIHVISYLVAFLFKYRYIFLKISVKFCRVCVECKSWEATICLLLNENKFSLWYTNTLAHKERKNKESFVIKFHFKFVSQTLLVLHTEYLIMEPLFWGSHQLKSMDEKEKVIKYLITSYMGEYRKVFNLIWN